MHSAQCGMDDGSPTLPLRDFQISGSAELSKKERRQSAVQSQISSFVLVRGPFGLSDHSKFRRVQVLWTNLTTLAVTCCHKMVVHREKP
jgi:hypothetical protein